MARPRHLLTLIVIATLTLASCNVLRSPFSGRAVEDFDQFYSRFNTDSSFQMSRIHFPIKGMAIDGNSRTEWTPSNWRLIRSSVYDVDRSQFQVSYNKTETEFTQKVWIENSGFSSEVKFELINRKWYLVYALDQNL